MPLAFRRALLARLVEPQRHRVEIVEHKEVRTSDVAQRRLELANYFEEVSISDHHPTPSSSNWLMHRWCALGARGWWSSL